LVGECDGDAVGVPDGWLVGVIVGGRDVGDVVGVAVVGGPGTYKHTKKLLFLDTDACTY